MINSLAVRYVRWIDRHRRAILVAAGLLFVGAGLLAARLPVYSDFSYLLPQDAPSVRQLRELEQRVNNFGTVMLAVVSDDTIRRAAAAQVLRDRIAAIDNGLVSDISFDDKVARRFVWEHRFLYASLADLEAARDQLNREILAHNPLYVDFEKEPAAPKDAKAASQPATQPAQEDPAAALQKKLDAAERKKDAPGTFVSDDGKMQLIIVRTSFVAGTIAEGDKLVTAIRRAADETRTLFPGVTIGITGDILTGQAEDSALLAGMLRSTLLTVLIVAAGLVLYYRSVRAVGALLWSLVVGTVVTFGVTRLTIGHLNLASGFLSSIVIGNGINFGMILLARHLEERRRGLRGVDAIAAAIAGTFTGTLVAALTSAVAYGSLAATHFRGFKHFGVIGGVGMVLCWISAYTILPAALALLERHQLRVGEPPAIGKLLAHLAPRSNRQVGAVVALALVVTAAAGVAAWRFLQHPYEVNFRNLRSSNSELVQIRTWLSRIDKAFGSHISGGFVIAAPTREQARQLAIKLKQVDEGHDAAHKLFGKVNSLDDVLPADQEQKLAVLADLRKKIDHGARNLDDAERATAERLRPPDDLEAIGDADIPAPMAWPFTEKNHDRGLLILVDSGRGYDTWLANDLLEFTARVESLGLGPETLHGGANFVFADVIRSMEGDGPRATLIAVVGALLVVAFLVGLRRHGVVTIVCMVSGTLLMIACGWLAGLRVNFLDFVALPITIGIGIDYSVNIVIRERQEVTASARATLATTGGAVLMCSFTTIVGYGSLLLSANQGIRSFALAAILGELTCITSALILAPALLQLARPRVGGPR